MSAGRNETAKHVTIVGGGFTGAAFARHLLRGSLRPVLIDIVEPRPRLGAGVAYSHGAPHQTTNIPAARMSVDADDPQHFLRWLADRGEDIERGSVENYPVRAQFATYMAALLEDTEPANSRSRFRHRRARVTGVTRLAGGFRVELDEREAIESDVVVLATGNPTPLPPSPLARLDHDPRVILDPWRPDALATIKPDDRVLMVGTGLTMGEAVSGLTAVGHRGSIVAISRRGRRPERGMVAAPGLFGDFADHRPSTAIALLRHFRAVVRRAEAAGLSWRPVAAAVRVHGWDIWGSLPAQERRRFVRHLRPYWEALRHVMPGPVHDLLREEEERGRLSVFAASVEAIEAHSGGIDVILHERGAPRGEHRRDQFDAIVNCTGPAYATLTRTDPFWSALARGGLVVPDGVGLGIAVDRRGRALGGDGVGQPDLLVLGTLARGTFGELTGIPELSRQARDAATSLAESWGDGLAQPPSILMKSA